MLTVPIEDDEHSEVVVAGVFKTGPKSGPVSTVLGMLDHRGSRLLGDPGRLVSGAVINYDHLASVSAGRENDTPDGLVFVECWNCDQHIDRSRSGVNKRIGQPG